MDPDGGTRTRRALRGVALAVLVVLLVSVAWWIVGRATADSRRLVVRSWAEAPAAQEARSPADTLRILAWNLAHGRGDEGPGLFRNFRGGSEEERTARLARIAMVLRRVDADVVVLNEVDFDASWSGGLNQAEVLALAAGYPAGVEQRNYDVRLPFGTLSFGNAVLSRRPILDARWVEIPPHSRLEEAAVGAKEASVVRLSTGLGPLSVVPVHLEVRSQETRLAAVPVLDSLRLRATEPVVLAGDFNSSPPGWPGAAASTALSELLARGWRSPRTEEPPGPAEWTFPTYDPRRGIDWVLVEPPLRAVEARVVTGTAALSDHAPVVAVITSESGEED